MTVKVTDCNNNKMCSNYSTGIYHNHIRSFTVKLKPILAAEIVNSEKKIIFNIVDENDNSPKFVQKTFTGGVQRDAKIGTRVTRLKVQRILF